MKKIEKRAAEATNPPRPVSVKEKEANEEETKKSDAKTKEN